MKDLFIIFQVVSACSNPPAPTGGNRCSSVKWYCGDGGHIYIPRFELDGRCLFSDGSWTSDFFTSDDLQDYVLRECGTPPACSAHGDWQPKGWWERWCSGPIIDDLEAACLSHDQCYSYRGLPWNRSKYRCDDDQHKNGLSICNNLKGVADSWFWKEPCIHSVHAKLWFHDDLQIGSLPFWVSAQIDGCGFGF
ncbi:Oidioi.mRNA.OKI2018_I69.chr1.g1621.t1.cds [Oikopleura dioica]|uniref:Oidioi.mRNA.OKI2018_I69.chr1.g1621.t1.cds n=1 Tax=Oikopleura dioica TaxID=34765 RepID=A0ABN7SNH5_OIKDI|nr:Oidioi.mRNA.OKI2018_I69.chr1.g1621.t1.cds [Oikopleura dioica]